MVSNRVRSQDNLGARIGEIERQLRELFNLVKGSGSSSSSDQATIERLTFDVTNLKSVPYRLEEEREALEAMFPNGLSLTGVQTTNWDDAKDLGFYWGDNAANQPTGGTQFFGLVEFQGGINSGRGRVVQTIRDANNMSGSETVWRRFIDIGGTWQPWVAISGSGAGQNDALTVARGAQKSVDNLITWSVVAPFDTDGADKIPDSLWFQIDGSSIIGIWNWNGGTWEQRTLGLDALDVSIAESIENAYDAAIDAKAAADLAQLTADQAASAAAAAAGIADSKADVLFQATSPAFNMRKDTTLWIETANNANTPRRWDTSKQQWVAISDKLAVEGAAKAIEAYDLADRAMKKATDALDLAMAAMAAADDAQTTADGKNTIYREDEAPTGGTYTVGDVWFDTNNGNRISVWNGTGWADALVGSGAIASGAITAAELSTNVNNTIAQGIADAAAAASAAGAAQGTADNALTSANSKNKVFYTATAPSTGVNPGDIWFNTAAGYRMSYRTATNTWQTAQDSAAAQSTANSKIKTYAQDDAPTSGMTSGDVWIDTNDGNKMYRYNGSAWVNIQDGSIASAQTAADAAAQAAADALAAALAAQNAADGSISTYYQDTAPWANGSTQPEDKIGDLWFQTSTNQSFRWNGTEWVMIQDNAIGAALAAAAAAQNTADRKITAFYVSPAPTSGMETDDLWFDTSAGNKPYRYNGSAWVSIQDGAIATAQSTANSKNRTFIQTTAPTAQATGDIWIDTSNGNVLKRWSGSAWINIQDAAIATAQSAATTAQSTANGKNKVYYTSTSPATTGNTTGDVWFDTANGYRMSVWNGTAWIASQLGTNAISDSAISTSKIANDAVNAAKILNGAVDSTKLATAVNTSISAAKSAADAAQTTADNAATAASTAAGIANSKGKVLIQSSAPAAADQLAQNLWIDTTNGLNAPKRWSGSAWVVVTDKVATDAAAAAANAQTAANGAKTAADNAQTAANAAQTTADGKNKVYRQNTSPGTTGNKVGDTWFDTANGNRILVWDGTTWSASALGSAAIAGNAIDSTKLTAQINTDIAKGISDAAAAQSTANTAKTTADGKNKVWYQGTQPSNTGNTTGDVWYDTSNDHKMYRWTGSAWAAALVGGAAISDSAISTSKIAQDAVTAVKIANGAVDSTKLSSAVNTSIITAQTSANDARTAADNAATAASSAQTTANSAKTNADQALADAATAAGIAGGKGKFIVQSAEPAAVDRQEQNLWIDTTNGTNTPKRWSGSAWVAVTDKTATDAAAAAVVAKNAADAAQASANNARSVADGAKSAADAAQVSADGALSAAGAAQTTADGKNRIWRQGTAPSNSGNTVGDLWFNTADGNKISTWSGSSWVLQSLGSAAIADGAITATQINSAVNTSISTANSNASKALTDAAAAQTTANGKNKVYYQGTQPTGAQTGDTWFDTANGYKLYTYTGSAWQLTQDAAAALTAANNAQTRADQKTQTYIGTSTPTMPSGGFTVGDIWIDTANGNQQKRWSGSAWVDIRDTTIATAQTAANNAMTAANGKNKVYYQSTQPGTTGNTAGDTWFDTANGNRIYRWSGSAWVASDLGSSAIADSAITNAKIANLDAGKITTGTLDANRIAANTITANKIALGDFENVVNDPGFELNGVGWQGLSAGTTFETVTDAPAGGNKVLQVVADGTIKDISQPSIRVTPGDKWYAEVWVRKVSGTDTSGNVGIQATLSGTGQAWVYPTFSLRSIGTLTNGQWVKIGGVVTIPALYDLMSVRLTVRNDVADGVYQFDTVSMRRMNTGELIVDGSISATKMVAGTITAASAILADAAVTTAKIADAQISSAKIIDAAITTAKIQDAAITNAKIASLDAGKITAGTLDANRIGANTINASKIAISDLNDYVADPYFDNVAVTMPPFLNGGGAVLDVSDASVPTDSRPATLKSIVRLGTTYDLYTQQQSAAFAVKPGEKYRISAWVSHIGTNTGGLGLRVWVSSTAAYTNGVDQGGWSYPQVGVTAASAQDKWVLVEGVITIPDINASGSGTKQAPRYGWTAVGPGNQSGWLMGSFSVRRMTAGELIVDGAITASKMQAGTITASSGIIADAAITTAKINDAAITTAKIGDAQITNAKIANIDAGKITTGYLDAGRIQAQSITGTMIAGGTVTASNMVTGTITAASGVIANGAIGTAQIGDAQITTAKINDAAITTAKIGDAQITSAKIANLDAGKITSGTIDANRIAAGSISTSKLVVSDLSNLAEVGDMQSSDARALWPTTTGFSYINDSTYSLDPSAPWFIRAEGVPAHGEMALGVPFPVSPGEKINVEYLINKTDSPSVPVGVLLYVTAADGTTVVSDLGTPPHNYLSRAWSEYTFETEIPVSVPVGSRATVVLKNTSAGPLSGGTWSYAAVRVRRMASAELIVDGSITTQKIAAGAIYANSGIIQNAAITTANIENAAITDAKIANIDAGKITTGYLDAGRIQAQSITGTMISGGTVTAANMVTGTITASSGIIADAAITTAKINDAAITTAKIGDAQITNAKIASLDAGKITTGYLSANLIAANTITGTMIAGNTITANNMVTGTITAASGILADAAITTAKIADATISTAKIADAAITSAKIEDLAVTNAKIATIDAGKITAGTIDANRIGAGTISAEKLTVGAFTDNLVINGGFEDALSGWTHFSTGVGTSGIDTTTANVRSGLESLTMTRTTGTVEVRQTPQMQIAVSGGSVYRLTSWARGAAAVGSGYYLRVWWFTETGAAASTTFSDAANNSAITTAWAERGGMVTAPSNARYARIAVLLNQNATIYVDEISMRAQVPGSVIVNGTITGSQIAGNTITADKITVGAITDNLVVNGGFEDSTLGWTTLNTGGTGGSAGLINTIRRSGVNALQMTRGTANVEVQQASAQYIPVSGGSDYRVSAWVSSASNTTNGFYLRVFWFLENRSTAASSVYTEVAQNVPATTVWTERSGVVKAPADARFAAVRVYNAWSSASVPFYVDDVSMRGLLPGEVLVNGSVTATQMAAGTITAASGILADAAITNAKIANGAIDNAKIANLDAGKITTGVVNADRIGANTITADKLTIGSVTENIASNGSFEDGMTGWTILTTPADPDTGTAAGFGGIAELEGTLAADGVKSVKLTQSGAPVLTFGQSSDKLIPVSPVGEKRWYVAVRAYTTDTAFVGGFETYVNWFKADKVTPASTASSGVAINGDLNPNTWTLFNDQVLAPADARWMQVVLSVTKTGAVVYADNVVVREVIPPTMIQDGAITTSKLKAGAVDATAIAAGAITTDKLAVGAITADSIASGSISTTHLTAGFAQALDLTGNGQVNILVNRVASVEGDVEGAQTQVSELKAYYNFTDEGAIIGRTDDKFQLHLKSDRIEFQENGGVLTYWDSGQMVVNRFVGTEVILGNHKLEKYVTGTVVRAITSA